MRDIKPARLSSISKQVTSQARIGSFTNSNWLVCLDYSHWNPVKNPIGAIYQKMVCSGVRHRGSCAYSSGLAFTPKEGEREGEEEGWRESTGGCRGGKPVARARGVAGSAMAMRGPGRLDPVVAGE